MHYSCTAARRPPLAHALGLHGDGDSYVLGDDPAVRRGSPTAAPDSRWAVLPIGTVLAIPGGARFLYVEMHHPFDHVVDHLAQQIGVLTFSRRPAKCNAALEARSALFVHRQREGLLVDGEALHARLRSELETNFAKANAWHLKIGERGEMTRVAEGIVQDAQPADWFMQRIEDWLFAHLPIEDKM